MIFLFIIYVGLVYCEN